MKKRKCISLIETLISLTIVGVALVALLPVVTVRKDGNDPTHGNRYWQDEGTYYTTDYNTSIGTPEPDGGLVVEATGFGNNDLLPLNVTAPGGSAGLMWNTFYVYEADQSDADISKDTGYLHFKAGNYADKGAGVYAYSRNLYYDDSVVALENNTKTDYSLYNLGWVKEMPNLWYSGLRTTDSYYTISNNNTEYVVVDKTNKIIGIGKDAAKFYPAENFTGTGNFIGIFNNPSDGIKVSDSTECVRKPGSTECVTDADGNTVMKKSAPSGMNGNNGGLIIGVKPKTTYNLATNGYGVSDDFVIYHPTGGDFLINADVSLSNNFKASSVILPSDKQLKNILYDYTKGIDEILKIKPVEYTFKNDDKQNHHVGVIAQDLQKIFPEAVAKNQSTGYLMIAQEPMFYAMINAIKKINDKNISIKKENDKLEQKIEKLRTIRDSLKASQGGENEK